MGNMKLIKINVNVNSIVIVKDTLYRTYKVISVKIKASNTVDLNFTRTTGNRTKTSIATVISTNAWYGDASRDAKQIDRSFCNMKKQQMSLKTCTRMCMKDICNMKIELIQIRISFYTLE